MNDILQTGSSTEESSLYIEFPDGIYPSDLGLKEIYGIESNFVNG